MNAIKTAEKKKYAEGRAEGRAEGEKEMALSIAKKMKEAGMEADAIAQMTGLSDEEVAVL